MQLRTAIACQLYVEGDTGLICIMPVELAVNCRRTRAVEHFERLPQHLTLQTLQILFGRALKIGLIPRVKNEIAGMRLIVLLWHAAPALAGT